MKRSSLISILAALLIPIRRAQASEYRSNGTPTGGQPPKDMPMFWPSTIEKTVSIFGQDVFPLYDSSGRRVSYAIMLRDKDGVPRRFVMDTREKSDGK